MLLTQIILIILQHFFHKKNIHRIVELDNYEL